MAEQVTNSSGSVNTGYVAPIGVSQGSQSSVPSWFQSADFGQLSSSLGSSLGGSFGTALGAAFGSDGQLGGLLGQAGSMLGGKVASNIVSGKKAFSGINSESLGNLGYGLAGNVVGNAIGGDAGRAVGTAVSNIGNITKAVKGLNAASKASKAANAAAKVSKLTTLGNVSSLAGIGASIASEFMPEKTEYSGAKGGVTQGLDTAYDLASSAVSFIPGVGTVIGGAMQVAKLLGQGVNALGGGTDGMTTADAILGSSFFNWTPMGMVNGFFGNTTNTIEKDQEAFNTVGSSYGGTQSKVDEAVTKSGKKYGLVSNSARKKADKLINRANTEQGRLIDIANEASIDRQIVNTMNQENSFNIANQMQGGLDYFGIRAGKNGLKIFSDESRIRAKELLTKTKEEPLKTNWEASWNDWEPTWEEEFVVSYKEGGSITESKIEKHQEESKNVIPEGALHARLHHMEQEGITKKGIPVITAENGEIVQHAEIERNEIIFRLEVTKKIEELAKDGSDEAAIEAGKLLVIEILENTDDRTGLLSET